jgi:hypothetical protein
MLQRGTNTMANQVTAPISNYFEKVLYENLTFEIPPLWFLKVVEGPMPLFKDWSNQRMPSTESRFK